jgi:hypothetical protein
VEAVTVELIAAVTDLQRALQLVERWSSWLPRAQLLGMVALEMIVGNAADELGHGVMRGVRGAGDWSDRAEAAIVVELSAPTARVTAALARAVLLADQDVVNAAVKVSDAMPAVTAAYADTPLIPTRKKTAATRAARTDADTALQNALAELIIVARERMHPTPPPPWWRRAGRRLVPGARKRAALAANASTGPDGGSSATGAVSAPAQPALTP